MAVSHYRRRHTLHYKRRHRRHKQRHHPYHQPRQQDTNSDGQEQMENTMENVDNYDDAVSMGPASFLDVGLKLWPLPLPLPEPSLTEAWRWCSRKLHRTIDWVRDTVFPSRVYTRELRDTKNQLLLLQEQLEQLQRQTQQTNASTSIRHCICPCQLSATSLTAASEQGSAGAITAAAPMSEPTPPALAPPPPPPLPAVAQPPMKVVLKKRTTVVPSSANPGSKQAAVTLNDIKNVKLRTVAKGSKPLVDSTKPGVVTLADIRNIQLKKPATQKTAVPGGCVYTAKDALNVIRLRKRHPSMNANDENVNMMVLRSRISEEALQYRQCLRKVSVVRSPGGTPMRGKLRGSQGTGLTPLMTSALRRKFRMARSRTPSPQDVAMQGVSPLGVSPQGVSPLGVSPLGFASPAPWPIISPPFVNVSP